MRLAIPEPLDRFNLAMEDDTAISVRRHGNPDGVRLFISHGNGFAVDGYLPFWQLLLDDFELILFDFRNHGQSPPSSPDQHHYPQMARDLERIHSGVTERLGQKKCVGVFHSMSARAAMKHAIEIGWRWDALILFDPPNVPPTDHSLYPGMEIFENKLVEWARGRKSTFETPAELAQGYARSRAHCNWVEGAHELMANAVTRRHGSDAWTLCCDPQLEAAIYKAALSLNLWPAAADFGGPVKLIGADPEGASPTGATNKALSEEHDYLYQAIPGAGHMLQLEKPQECVHAMTTFLKDCSIT